MSISKLTSKVVGDKRRYREYKARTAQLPESYRTAIDALERYLMMFGPGKAQSIQSMLDDLADLFEQSAASSTPVRAVVGQDPVEFMDEFLKTYRTGDWNAAERDRLSAAIRHAAGEEGTR